MARRKSKRRISKMEPAITDLFFTVAAGGTAGGSTSYVDTARELSKLNRRMYSQSRMYAYQGLTFVWRQSAASPLASLEIKVSTAGNSWVVQNAHTKGKALWDQMQDLVLEDNPSVAGTWHDFKVKLDYLMSTGRIISCQDSAGVDVAVGEWDYATFVMPQHDVDPATGLPLDAAEFTANLIGVDTTLVGPPVTGTRSLVKAYQESRATVQPEDPNIPAGLSTSFFNLLTDSGSQEPELAEVIEDENNEPPYDADDYVGGGVNAVNPMLVAYAATSAAEVDGRIGGFVAPCGLLHIEIIGRDGTGAVLADAVMPAIDLILKKH